MTEEQNRVTSGNLTHRTTTQPYQQYSCGSVFRNPEPEKAGQLIEAMGLEEHASEGRVSPAPISLSTGDALAKDIHQLIELVQNHIEAGRIRLHPGVKRLGFDSAT